MSAHRQRLPAGRPRSHRSRAGRRCGSRCIVIAVVWIAPFVFILFTALKANSTVMGSKARSRRRRASNGATSPAPGRAAISARRCSTASVITLDQGAARPVHFGDGGLRAEPHSSARRARDLSARPVRHDAAVPGDARAAVHAGQSVRPDQHLCRHHPSLSRLRRALSGVHPARLLQRSSEGAERSGAGRRRVALHHLSPHLPADRRCRFSPRC